MLGGVVKGERAPENLAKALLSESLQKEARGIEESQWSNNPKIGQNYVVRVSIAL